MSVVLRCRLILNCLVHRSRVGISHCRPNIFGSLGVINRSRSVVNWSWAMINRGWSVVYRGRGVIYLRCRGWCSIDWGGFWKAYFCTMLV